MPNDPIRAALQAAGEAMIVAAPDVGRGAMPERNGAAAVIIAFLRALPHGFRYPITPAHVRGITTEALRALADALERHASDRSGACVTVTQASPAIINLLRLMAAGPLRKFPQHSAGAVNKALREGWIELDVLRGHVLTAAGRRVLQERA